MNEKLRVTPGALGVRPRDLLWYLPITLGDCPIPAYPIEPDETLPDLDAIDLWPDWDDGMARLIRAILTDPAD